MVTYDPSKTDDGMDGETYQEVIERDINLALKFLNKKTPKEHSPVIDIYNTIANGNDINKVVINTGHGEIHLKDSRKFLNFSLSCTSKLQISSEFFRFY